ncbi:MAG: hypothetical protein LBR08_00175 [Bacteroidales bacterium]|nr:hypothetical protein [Bacteroidales bacterium]
MASAWLAVPISRRASNGNCAASEDRDDRSEKAQFLQYRETEIFSASAWPTIGANAEWGIGDGSGSGKWWKSLGNWNGGNPVYPKLWFEE